MDNVYLRLTREFNAGGLRAVICSGQAIVLHRLAVASKDGDWIVREDAATPIHILGVLAAHGARYRFGAPLEVRWLRGGWSSHLEFQEGDLRVRTDFFSRPPRLSPADLARMWHEQEGRDPPFLGPRDLAELKKTDRERDYPFIGELARLMSEVADQFLYARSARDLIALAARHPDVLARVVTQRPVLRSIGAGREALSAALDAERRELMRAYEARLGRFQQAARSWGSGWPALDRELRPLALFDAHRRMTQRAEGVLPFAPGEA